MQIQGIGKRMNSEYMGWRGTVNYIYRQAGIMGFTRGFLACLGSVQKLNHRNQVCLDRIKRVASRGAHDFDENDH